MGRLQGMCVALVLASCLGLQVALEDRDSSSVDALSPTNQSAAVAADSNYDLDPSAQNAYRTDLDPKGNCSEEIKIFCSTTSDSFLDCITEQLKKEEQGLVPPDGVAVKEQCKESVRSLKIALYDDMTLNVKLEAACQKDIKDFCSDDFQTNALGCLREIKDTLSQACQDEVFIAEQDAANDFKMDPMLNKLCSDDARQYCKEVTPGEGKIQNCLRGQLVNLSPACQSQLFRQEQENADDLRLDVQLYKACVNDKIKFCPHVKPGHSRVKDCLESHRLDPEFSDNCKRGFDRMLGRQGSDFRLDPALRNFCWDDASEMCPADLEDQQELPNDDARVVHCLQDVWEKIKNSECKKEVHRLIVRAAEDYIFDTSFADKCRDARTTFCNGTSDEYVLQCLQHARDQLDDTCRATLFDMEMRLSGNIDFKPALKQSCTGEIGYFCKGLNHGQGIVIDCLQKHVEDVEMGDECKRAVLQDEVQAAKDYRLTYGIYSACDEDVRQLCSKTCQEDSPCGGTVLKCLQKNMENLQSETCKKELFIFEEKEVRNIELDVPLQKACRNDLANYCSNFNKDHSNQLSCLRLHRQTLAAECKAEELYFSMMEASDIRLTPSLMNACGAELGQLCKSVSTKNGEAFKCLQTHLQDVAMGAACKGEVNLQEARQASDYRMDIRVRTECHDDVNQLCHEVDKNEEGHASVLKCFVSNYRNLSGGCQTEVAYAVRMALWQYKLNASLTAPCDFDVNQFCSQEEAKPIQGVIIGTYGQCLITHQKKALSAGCKALVQVASVEGFYIGNNTEANIAATIAKLNELNGIHGSDTNHAGAGIFWVTTVFAFVAMLGFALFRRRLGPPKTYTLVVKGGDV